MWTRKSCLFSLYAVIFIAGVWSSDSPKLGTDALVSEIKALQDKLKNVIHPIPLAGEETVYRSCKEIPAKVSGKYEIQFGANKTKLPVYCEQSAFDGGWIVFQRRVNGSVDFYRTWAEYRDGCGSLEGEFWLGLESLHQLTTARPHELMVEIKDYRGNYGYAQYRRFVIGSESEGYSLKIGNYSGTAGESLVHHSDMKFSTKDADNDDSPSRNCAVERHGAWWYTYCGYSNLNGKYGNRDGKEWTGSLTNGMHWFYFMYDLRSMSYSRMMVREVNPNNVA